MAVVFHSVIPSLITQVKVRGKARFVTFLPKGRPFNYGYLQVGDPDMIAAIKKHPYFGKYITVAHEDKPEVPVEAEAAVKTQEEVKKKEYPEVTKTQEAKEILKNEYDYPVESIRSKAAAHVAAEEVGIVFPNL